jgi:HPt (histidine-containing phosphotransfer) domain-containing protein
MPARSLASLALKRWHILLLLLASVAVAGIMDRVVEDYRDFPENLRAALASDAADALRQAHTLKRLAATVGAHALAGIAGRVERALRQPASLDAVDLVDLFAEHERVFRGLEAYIARVSAGGR